MNLSDARLCPCCGGVYSHLREHLAKRTFRKTDGSRTKLVTPCSYRHAKQCRGICMRSK